MDAGRQFLAANAKKPGVVTTGSGLQYKVLREGTGRKPSAYGEVEVHYKGSLIDGTVFDSSYERGEPISFLLAQVIPGWAEGVQLMSAGAQYEFYIPFELGYGAQGIPGDIPPYSTLIFEVELLTVYS
jgi:FKBP-type peptidyl-prolyl cis-trans isomerase FkpA/FKBP-type peptidyl-prolyl cis-trans isomerase FklB